MNKLLSIIVPVYNTQDYLSRCLDSLCVPQYLEQIEVIVVIDGSPDQSITIANRYKEKYPGTFIVVDKENGGHGSAINVGIKLAQGKYVRILDSDDWFDEKNFPVFIEKLTKEDEDLVMTHTVKEYTGKCEPFVQKIKEHNTTYKVEDIIDQITDTSFAMSRCTYKTARLREHGLVLLENQSYDDGILHVFPLVFLKSFNCYDMVIYHYFLERPEQSVHQKKTLRLCKHHENVLDQRIELYNKYKNIIPEKNANFIKNEIKNLADILYVMLNDLEYKEAKKELKRYNKKILSVGNKEFLGVKGRYYNAVPYSIFRLTKKIYEIIYPILHR